MKQKKSILKIGVIGCGAIGSGIAKSVKNDLNKSCKLSGLFDVDEKKTFKLEKKLKSRNLSKTSISQLIKSCDLVVEAVNAQNTADIIKQILKQKRSVLVMSVGKIIQNDNLFRLAKKNNCSILVPSGAIAGLDAIKAASLAGISKISITTRKPPKGLKSNPYLEKQKINVTRIKKETVLFDGTVKKAVKAFPQNINVAAALALASNAISKLKVKIITSPKFKTNSHEIEVAGKFGKLVTRSENMPCPDNPKTSYLAVLSGIQTLKQFSEKVFIGS